MSQPSGGRCSSTRCIRVALFLSLYFLLFLPCCSLLLAWLERPAEAASLESLRRLRWQFLNQTWFSCRVSEADLDVLLASFADAGARGAAVARGGSRQSDWTFGGAMFFVSTLVTTVGYGRGAPMTQAGRAACLAICVLGIPATFLAVGAMSAPLRRPSRAVLAAIRRCVPRRLAVPTHAAGVVAGSLLVFVLAPAAIFVATERPRWTFADAVYFCVVTLTTIGLGDLVAGDGPNQRHRELYKLGLCVYLFAGLAAAAFAVKVLAEAAAPLVGRAGASFLEMREDPGDEAAVEAGDDGDELLAAASCDAGDGREFGGLPAML